MSTFWILYMIALNGSPVQVEDVPVLRTALECEAAAVKANGALGYLAPELNGKLFICKTQRAKTS
jgi:hypothetical protein